MAPVGQIIRMLREAEVHLSQGKSAGQVNQDLGITEQTDSCGRKKQARLEVFQAGCLHALWGNNSRWKKAVADSALNKVILQEALIGNHCHPGRCQFAQAGGSTGRQKTTPRRTTPFPVHTVPYKMDRDRDDDFSRCDRSSK